MFQTKLRMVAAVLLGVGVPTLTVGGLAANWPWESRSGAAPPNVSGEALVGEVENAAQPPAQGGLTLGPAKGEGTQRTLLVRAPDHGIQPQVVVDAKGVLHLLYFKGDPANGDVYYARSQNGTEFQHPLRVNSQPGSAIAIGNIRGAHLALGKNVRAHVAWNGSGKAAPKAPGDTTPMLYARLDDVGTAFEPQRNLIRSTGAVLDGGGSVAADGGGNVYVFWHSPGPDQKGEQNRRVWVAVSTDDGKTFAAEKAASDEPTGACGCCGLRAFADNKGTVYALFRGARTPEQRDMYLLTSAGGAKGFMVEDIHPWAINTCPMSSEAFAEGPGQVVAAWETNGQVYFTRIDLKTGKRSAPVAATGAGHGRKHPAVAVNANGETILAWTEGMGWNKGGSLAWQVYDRDSNPTDDHGQAAGVPVWSLIAAYVRQDGRFAIVY
jgi:hypothetical protein